MLIGAAKQVQACFLGFELEVLAAEHDVILPGGRIVDDRVLDICVDATAEDIPLAGWMSKKPSSRSAPTQEAVWVVGGRANPGRPVGVVSVLTRV